MTTKLQQPGATGHTSAPADAMPAAGQYGRYREDDLLFYHLDVRVDPEKRLITGKNTIRFRMLADDTRVPSRSCG